jgi:hypothetical protein
VTTVEGSSPQAPRISGGATAILALLGLFGASTAMGLVPVAPAAAALAFLTAMIAWHRTLLEWRTLVWLIVVVVLFIPLRRYELPISLPFVVEPYRVLVAIVAAGWCVSLLIDPSVRVHPTHFEKPLAAFGLCALASLVLNPHRIAAAAPEVTKGVMFFASFFIVTYLIASVTRRELDMKLIIRTLVTGGAIVSASAVYEARTGYNVFDHLTRVMPFLRQGALPTALGDPTGFSRGGQLRAYASAQHPIALGAALVMLMPLALALALDTKKRRWWLALALLGFGMLASRSRTGITMLVIELLVFLWLRPRETRRLWPLLIFLLPLIHFALPGTLGTLKNSFFPAGGLVAQQTNQAVGSGRLATLGPALDREFKPNPLFGEGFQTRVTVPSPGGSPTNGPILDNQWLGLLLETGAAGAASFAWLFVLAVRKLGRAAKEDDTSRGWLAAALAAAIASYGVGMLTFDAFSFIQVTILLFITLGIGGSVLSAGRAGTVARGLPVRTAG